MRSCSSCYATCAADKPTGAAWAAGRYDKHDTARLRSIKDIALRGLPFGELVCEDDLRMLRLAPQNELGGPDKVGSDGCMGAEAWA
eukprot:CAMPEP_0181227634 /NCGR_PEP_ID=MMETSP1096-20121128/32895_1 /TAXON_ID=156174 ORGANISM="Chrysochromulina ericina, Strain CCMP281" /NCGR_SAMPLE_ID=MMETSP1096 /ASSEMBLY_ACC=CAM_ASM_000453 /LENGTH=85 /DNA_ID=CAMNT_0023321057 /DNA_START=52 /DNA_END=309 /DNA_ORIENTATION=-